MSLGVGPGRAALERGSIFFRSGGMQSLALELRGTILCSLGPTHPASDLWRRRGGRVAPSSSWMKPRGPCNSSGRAPPILLLLVSEIAVDRSWSDL